MFIFPKVEKKSFFDHCSYSLLLLYSNVVVSLRTLLTSPSNVLQYCFVRFIFFYDHSVETLYSVTVLFIFSVLCSQRLHCTPHIKHARPTSLLRPLSSSSGDRFTVVKIFCRLSSRVTRSDDISR